MTDSGIIVTEADREAAREWNRDHGGCCDGALAIAFALHAAQARLEAEQDIALWKREAENRSQGMIDLNLDRAAQGVEISILREIVGRYGDRIAMANAPAYLQHAIDDAISNWASTRGDQK